MGIYSNFYSLGGNSIVSIRVVSQANQQGVKITVGDLVKHATIHALADVAIKRANPQLQGKIQLS